MSPMIQILIMTSLTLSRVTNVAVEPTVRVEEITLVGANNGHEAPHIITFCLVKVISPLKVPHSSVE